MYRHYELVTRWGVGTYFADPYTAWQHRNQRAPQRSDPTLPTHTHRLPNRDRGRTAGDHHRDQQPTPTTPRPGSTSRNLPTPHHHTTTVLHFRLEHRVAFQELTLSQCRRIRLVAYGARLESVLGESPRGFESPILRQCPCRIFGAKCPGIAVNLADLDGP